MGNNLPVVKRSCETCGRAHTADETADSYPGRVMFDAERHVWTCNRCWSQSAPLEKNGPDRPGNRMR